MTHDPWKRKEVIGNATLYLGDCLEILPHLPKAGAVITDPPYGINYSSGRATDATWIAGRSIAGDATTAVRDAVINMFGGPMLVFGTWKAPRPAQTKMVLIWDKGGALGMGDLSLPWKPDHEEIYVIGRGFVGTRDCGSVIRHPPVQSTSKNGRIHPTEKPVGLMLQLLRKTAGTVCDPFMGSGTTGVACMNLGRNFIGIEICEEYFNLAVERITNAQRQYPLFNHAEANNSHPTQMPILPEESPKEST